MVPGWHDPGRHPGLAGRPASRSGRRAGGGQRPDGPRLNSPLLPGNNGSARPLAEALAGAGIASPRYDKRGSGPQAREAARALAGGISLQGYVDRCPRPPPHEGNHGQDSGRRQGREPVRCALRGAEADTVPA